MTVEKKTIEQSLSEMAQKINENNGKINSFMESIKDYNDINMNLVGTIINMLMGEVKKLRDDVSQAYAKSVNVPPAPIQAPTPFPEEKSDEFVDTFPA